MIELIIMVISVVRSCTKSFVKSIKHWFGGQGISIRNFNDAKREQVNLWKILPILRVTYFPIGKWEWKGRWFNGSGKSREAHVPFCEGLSGKFRWSTLLSFDEDNCRLRSGNARLIFHFWIRLPWLFLKMRKQPKWELNQSG